MNRTLILNHYKKFFDLNAKGIELNEEDQLNIDWVEALIEDLKLEQANEGKQPDSNCNIQRVSNREATVCDHEFVNIRTIVYTNKDYMVCNKCLKKQTDC